MPSTSASARRALANETPGIRQRASNVLSFAVPPLYGRDRKNSATRSGRAVVGGSRDKGKGKEKEKARWEVGTKGWVKEGFRQFGAHCARNQASLS